MGENSVVKSSDWQNQMDLVKATVADNATTEEFQLLCHMAVRFNLDPLLRQIWLVKYGKKPAQIFAGRDGFLSFAHRSGQFNGMKTEVERVEMPIKVEKYGKDFDGNKKRMTVEREWQYKAVCTIYRKDAEHPFVVEVYEEEYTTCANLWLEKPRTMLGKVSESQCLRKAFDISGLYSPEEMPEYDERDITDEVKRAQEDFERKKGIKKDDPPPAEQKREEAIPAEVTRLAQGSFSHTEMQAAAQGQNGDADKILFNLATIFVNRDKSVQAIYKGRGMNNGQVKAHVVHHEFNIAKIKAAFANAPVPTIADVAREDAMPDDPSMLDDESLFQVDKQ